MLFFLTRLFIPKQMGGEKKEECLRCFVLVLAHVLFIQLCSILLIVCFLLIEVLGSGWQL